MVLNHFLIIGDIDFYLINPSMGSYVTKSLSSRPIRIPNRDGYSTTIFWLCIDDSGNRRFWICNTTKDSTNQIDCDGLLKERNSIWASAVSAYLNKEPWILDTESEAIVNNENVKYLIDSPWKSVVESYINEPKNRGRELTTEVVLTEAIEKPIERQTRGDQMQIASILRDLGLVKKRRGDRSSRKWVYIRDLDTISV